MSTKTANTVREKVSLSSYILNFIAAFKGFLLNLNFMKRNRERDRKRIKNKETCTQHF